VHLQNQRISAWITNYLEAKFRFATNEMRVMRQVLFVTSYVRLFTQQRAEFLQNFFEKANFLSKPQAFYKNV